MTVQEFDDTLRELMNREPFRPFVVEYVNGERFEVDGPYVAFCEGKAGFPEADNKEFHFFDHTNVRRFIPTPAEAVP